MRTYLDMLRSDPSLDTCILPVGDGVALSYKRMETEMDDEQGQNSQET
jgi:hypothetical protein